MPNLIKCPDCERDVSQRAVSCPSCGAPLGGGGSSGNIAFENRINEYKNAGYILQKRNSNSVVFIPNNKTMKVKSGTGDVVLICGCLTLIGGILLALFVSFLMGAIIAAFSVILLIVGVKLMYKEKAVIISITRTGQVEEVGNSKYRLK